LKPQVVFLVPVAVALSGHRRCLAGWAGMAALLVAVQAVALGPAGVVAYRQNLDHALDPVTTSITLWASLPRWVPVLPLHALVAGLALAAGAGAPWLLGGGSPGGGYRRRAIETPSRSGTTMLSSRGSRATSSL